ncbi:MAG: PepSY domain-containing protein [Rhodobacteraceae bacterium]|nr:PepSY domain-containing protein [Paracoccaceae bacterium]
MIRAFHKYTGLLAAVLLLVLALSGVALSVLPAWDKMKTPALVETQLTVAELATRIAVHYPEVEQIRRAPSGLITAYYYADDQPGAVVVDPATGQGVSDYEFSPVVRWLKNLHRSLLLDDAGRIAMAVAAVALLLMSISGALLLARRMGGWRKVFAPARGTLSSRLHVEAGRLSIVGLVLSSLTAVYLALGTFDILPQETARPAFPSEVSGEMGLAPAEMPALVQVPVSQLRSLTFPYAGDPSDIFTLTTDQGEGYIDQGTGEMLAWDNAGALQKLNEFIYLLHTGEGAWFWGLVLGLIVLGAPVLAVTGLIMWWKARRARPSLPKGVAAHKADTIILVGSEGGSTWGFAGTLMRGLMANGHGVFAAPLSRFAPEKYSHAKQIIVLAATYGNGEPPASAKGFLDKLAALKTAPAAKLAVLGFGDRQFPEYCAYAKAIVAQAEAMGWETLLPLDTVDQQSPQDFGRWGKALGAALGHELELAHVPVQPRTHRLKLVSRRDYGLEVQTPTAILRFALPRTSLLNRLRGRGWKKFKAGDLLGIIPEGSNIVRLYSLASSTRDGFVEICVRKHAHGLCSGQLFDLAIGDEVSGFIRSNPAFAPAKNRKPVILIGAGTGIGPLAGFARANHKKRPMQLYFGIRHPDSDYLYEDEIGQWQSEGKLDKVSIAASRVKQVDYVQHILQRDAANVAAQIKNGAQVLVCGGCDMALGVAEALQEILAPHGLEPAELKAQGRYLEDVY